MIQNLLPYRVRNWLDLTAHNRAIASVFDTPPITPKDDGLVLFSMIGTAVLRPYLVAVKSLWRQLERGRIVIMDDGTLTDSDKAALKYHCGDPEIIAIETVERGDFPKGGTWERFLTILDRRESEYWIQLDSDTVTTAPIQEVKDAIDTNRSFVLLGGADAAIGAVPCSQISNTLYPDGPVEGHIQHRIESRLDQLPSDKGWRYIRGCSGFAGFAAKGEGRPLAKAFLAEMESLIGHEDTYIWGTEQIASNFHLANEPDPVILPAERYINYWGEEGTGEAAFVHFVGTHRYDKHTYAGSSLAAIAELGLHASVKAA